MKQKQISNFLDTVLPGIKFTWKYGSNFQCEGSPAAVDIDCVIWINRTMFPRFEELEQKTILLHEVGHVLSGPFKSYVDTELCAQLVALGIAKKNGWNKLFRALDEMIYVEWRTEFSWNAKHGAFRRYILAGKKYKCLKDKHKLTSCGMK